MKLDFRNLIGIFDWFLPSGVRKNGGIDLVRTRHLNIISFTIAVIVIPFAYFRFGFSPPSGRSGWILLAGSLILFIAPLIVKYTGSLTIALTVAGGGLVTVLISYTQVTGGLFASSLLWYPLFPLLMTFYGGARIGLFLMAVLIGHVVYLYGHHVDTPLPIAIIENEKYFLLTAWSAAVAFIIAFVFGVIADRLHRQAILKVQEAEKSLRIANEALEQRIVDRTQDLVKSEERYRKLINHTLQGMAVIRDNEILFSNQAEAGMFGFDDPQQLLGTSIGERVAPEDFTRVAEYHAACQKGETNVRRYEFRGLRVDGSSFWIEALIDTIPWDDELAIQVVHVDISARKMAEVERNKLEIQLRQSQKMEAIGQLAGGVAHDFNNLLQIIIINTQLAMSDRLTQDQVNKCLRAVLDASNRAAALTRQLLAFGRRQVVNRSVLNPNEIINDQVQMLKRMIGERIEVEVKAGEDIWAVSADPILIGQVVMNLCVNARDAMPQGGRITLESRNTTLDEEFCLANPWATPGRYVELTVMDTGTGFRPEIKDHIFEPFFTTKEVGKGSGLGLSVVAGIVEQHNGLISADSVLGKGAIFRVLLSGLEERYPSVEPVTSLSVQGGSETILVAEDEDSVREITSRILRSAGYVVLEASNGEEAIDLFIARREDIDLLVLDAVMPRLDGKDVFLRIKNEYPDTQFLFCSGYGGDEFGSDFLAAYRVDFLPKPYLQENLLHAVRTILDKAELINR